MIGVRVLGLLLFAAVASVQDQPSNQPLFTAIQRGSVTDVERPLRTGTHPDAMKDGIPALMTAVLYGNVRMVQLLLDRGADPNKPGPSGATALMWAIPDTGKVRLLLAHGANVNARSDTERSPLLIAASYPGTTEILKLLLDRGAELRAQDRGGATALSLAARSSDIEPIRFFVDRGLDPNSLPLAAQNSALSRRDPAVVEYLMSKLTKAAPELLISTAIWQPPALLERWIQMGANVNASSPAAQYSKSPVLAAVTSENAGVESLDVLLRHGADPNAATTENESPLDWAIYKNDSAKIQLLEKYGAKRGSGPRSETIASPEKQGIGEPRISVNRSMARLLEVAPAFREKTPGGCVSCHHNMLPAIATASARKKGIEFDETRASKNMEDIFGFFKAAQPRMMVGDPAVGGEAISAGYSLIALAVNGHAPDDVTAAMTHWLLSRQMPDGRWLGNGVNRPPSEYSTISHTALATGGLKAYGLPGRQDQILQSLRRAQQWLIQAKPSSAEERAMRLMGLVWTEAPRREVSAAIKDVRDKQETNGGWSQFGRTPPDAYATGLSLYALALAGTKATDEQYQKGVRFLLDTQYSDGTWLVRTHAFPVQRYFESGFPFGHHQWISTAGTSWAVLAITHTLPDRPR